MTAPRPHGLLAELTHRCPLSCPYCSNPLALVPHGDELVTAEWNRLFLEAAALGVVQLGLSGGEPILRPDLVELVAAARAAGLYTNLITSAAGLTPALAGKLKTAGLDVVQVSLQADISELANTIAGASVHERKLAGTHAAVAAGLPLGINIVLHRQNIHRLAQMILLAESLGAMRIELASTQFYGWAFKNRTALLPSHDQVRKAAEIAKSESERLRGRIQIVYVPPDYYEKRPKPCLHGWGMRGITVDPAGNVLPCQAAEAIPGLEFDNIRQHDLAWIWRESEAFNRFRGTEWLPEPCHSCDFREIDFGGCRCQAALFTGDAARTDPVCEFSPDRPLLDRALAECASGGDWIYRG